VKFIRGHLSPRAGWQRGARNSKWKGGRKHTLGYVKLRRRDHPAADCQGYVMEHRLVMEQRIGRLLTSREVVHHVNGQKDDNVPENLWLFADDPSHRSWHAMLEHGHDLRVFMPAVPIAAARCFLHETCGGWA
jgi:hypothetical protein